MNLFLFAFFFAQEPTGMQTENIATIFHTMNNSDKKKEKTPKAQHIVLSIKSH